MRYLPAFSFLGLLADKGNRDKVISELRSNTGLSIRKMAELLDIDRRIVERTISK